MSITMEEILKLYEKANKMPYPSNISTYKEDYVFDEDKSVKWNREEVARRNAAYEEDTKRYRAAREAAYADAENATKMYIMERTGLSKKKASILFDYAYEEYRSLSINEMLIMLDSLVDLYNKLKGWSYEGDQSLERSIWRWI